MKDWLTSIVIINLHEDKYMKQAEKWKANSEKKIDNAYNRQRNNFSNSQCVSEN